MKIKRICYRNTINITYEKEEEPHMTDAELFQCMVAYLVGGQATVQGKLIKKGINRKENLKKAADLLLEEIERMENEE